LIPHGLNLGLRASTNEGTKHWIAVLTSLKNRGMKDAFIICTDGLKGFPEGIEAIRTIDRRSLSDNAHMIFRSSGRLKTVKLSLSPVAPGKLSPRDAGDDSTGFGFDRAECAARILDGEKEMDRCPERCNQHGHCAGAIGIHRICSCRRDWNEVAVLT
jgi:hypothetical protein